jgi:hypothetical protein
MEPSPLVPTRVSQPEGVIQIELGLHDLKANPLVTTTLYIPVPLAEILLHSFSKATLSLR